jgi:hypothetical protein
MRVRESARVSKVREFRENESSGMPIRLGRPSRSAWLYSRVFEGSALNKLTTSCSLAPGFSRPKSFRDSQANTK